MLDTLLELFERDKKPSSNRSSGSGGIRGRLASALDGERDDDRRYKDRRSGDRDRYDDRDNDDRYDDDRSSKRKKKREFDFLDFGD
jgi:hypothetical protein